MLQRKSKLPNKFIFILTYRDISYNLGMIIMWFYINHRNEVCIDVMVSVLTLSQPVNPILNSIQYIVFKHPHYLLQFMKIKVKLNVEKENVRSTKSHLHYRKSKLPNKFIFILTYRDISYNLGMIIMWFYINYRNEVCIDVMVSVLTLNSQFNSIYFIQTSALFITIHENLS